ncbi:MAG: aldehyde dehydrogenase family protein, partial [Candidatus Neomarinimicrobiota bacterium]
MKTDIILNELGIENINYGACAGPGDWFKTTTAGKIDSINPTNGEIIASVYQCSVDDYHSIVKKSYEAFKEWIRVPAPLRGELIRKMANVL